MKMITKILSILTIATLLSGCTTPTPKVDLVGTRYWPKALYQPSDVVSVEITGFKIGDRYEYVRGNELDMTTTFYPIYPLCGVLIPAGKFIASQTSYFIRGNTSPRMFNVLITTKIYHN